MLEVNRDSCLKGPVVKVSVGKGQHQQEFNLHKRLLCKVSSYFESALDGPFQESDGVVQLSETDPTTFSIFAQWLYLRDLKLVYRERQFETEHDLQSESEAEPQSEEEEKQEVKTVHSMSVVSTRKPKELVAPSLHPVKLSIPELYHLFIFADYAGVPSLKDAAVEAWRQRALETQEWDIAHIGFIDVWDSLPEGSRVKGFLVEGFGVLSDAGTWTLHDAYPADFLSRVLRSLCSVRDETRAVWGRTTYTGIGEIREWSKKSLCEYHEHGEGQPCCFSTEN